MGCDKIKILEKKFLFFMLLVGITFILSISQNTSSFVSYSTIQSAGYDHNNNSLWEHEKNPIINLKNMTIPATITPTDLTVCNIHGTINHYTFIKAYLKDSHGKPVCNKTITFKIEGDSNIYVAMTSNAGTALLYYYIFQNNGVYQIQADFIGDDNYSPSTSSNKLTIDNISSK